MYLKDFLFVFISDLLWVTALFTPSVVYGMWHWVYSNVSDTTEEPWKLNISNNYLFVDVVLTTFLRKKWISKAFLFR